MKALKIVTPSNERLDYLIYIFNDCLNFYGKQDLQPNKRRFLRIRQMILFLLFEQPDFGRIGFFIQNFNDQVSLFVKISDPLCGNGRINKTIITS